MSISNASDYQLDNLEKYRLQLEENVKKLEASLRHWQLWEIEYEGLKEEVEEVPSLTSVENLHEVKNRFERDVLSEKEIDELLGIKPCVMRTAEQVSHLITRRVDYVQRNVETIQKQLSAAQAKLDKVQTVQDPGVEASDGLPAMEILEEIDDDGNVLSGKVSEAGKSEVIQALAKAGIEEKDLAQGDSHRNEIIPTSNLEPQSMDRTDPEPSEPRPVASRRKSVTFTEDTKPGDLDDAPTDKTQGSSLLHHPTNSVDELAKGTFGPHERVLEIDENERIIGVNNYVMPAGDTPEEAALRRSLIQYSMSEVGSIVAEMNIEEADSDDSASWSDLEEIELPSDDDEDEDEHGLSHRSHISKSYHREMEELEARLNAQMVQNIGPRPEVLEDQAQRAQGAHRLVVKADEEVDALEKQTQPETSKSVRFAGELDIAPASTPSATFQDPGLPLAEEVVERPAIQATPSSKSPQKKMSRFKAARQAQAPSGPANQVLADTIVEHGPDEHTVVKSSTANALDPETHQREVVSEYYKQRNKLISRQGGFAAQKEQIDAAAEDAMDDDSQPRKKVSLFKAARVNSGAWK